MPLHTAARLSEIAKDRGLQVEIGNSKILLVLHSAGQVRAYQAECPHAGAPLADGAICNGRLICPWHKAAFAIDDGQLCEPPALDSLTRFPVQVVGDQVQVDDQPMSPIEPATTSDERCFAIVGAGAAGTAAASSLRQRGLAVTVLARHEVPFAGQFGERIGRAIRRLHEDNGVQFRTQVEATGFEGKGQLEAVTLDNGERLSADLVVVGTGVSPVTEWVEGIKREEDGSLRVDDTLRAAEGLWVAGDIATFALDGKPQRIEHWRLAQQQGRIAAHNMLGREERYSDVPFFWTHHFGKNFDYLGHAERWDEIVFEGSPERYEFVALLCQSGIVAAVVVCEYQRVTSMLAERMKRPLPMGEALKLIRLQSEQ